MIMDCHFKPLFKYSIPKKTVTGNKRTPIYFHLNNKPVIKIRKSNNPNQLPAPKNKLSKATSTTPIFISPSLCNKLELLKRWR